MLILPADEWLTPGFVWDPIAEGLHGLPLARLRAEGVAPSEVCGILNERLQDKIVIFDTGPDGVDRHWLDLLYFEGGQRRHFKLGGSASEVLLALAADHGLIDASLMQIRKRAPKATHCAAMDAAHYAWCGAAVQILSGELENDKIERVLKGITIRGTVSRYAFI